MDKAEYNKLLNKLIVEGINLNYGSISIRSEDKGREELISLITNDTSILDHHKDLKPRILDGIFWNYQKEIIQFLKKNIKKIESSKKKEC